MMIVQWLVTGMILIIIAGGVPFMFAMMGLAFLWLVGLPFSIFEVWWQRRYDVAEFGYFEQGPLDGQTTLQPAYAFVYEVESDFTHKSAEVVPAGEKSFGALKGKKRFPSPLELRR